MIFPDRAHDVCFPTTEWICWEVTANQGLTQGIFFLNQGKAM